MQKLKFYFIIILFIGIVLPAKSKNSKPNVIIVLTDDQGYGDLGVHGNPFLKTPNLDKLHEESIRFTDFHVAPMCAPTRGQLMTGVDGMRNGCMATCMGRATVREELPMMSEVFQDAGYRTGLFGKWHMGYNWPHRPMDRGFEEAVYHQGYGLTGMGHHWNSDYYDPFYYDKEELKQAKGWYCDDFWFSEAMKWIEQCHEKEEAFFCYLPTNMPHFPFWIDTVYSKPYEGSGAAEFYGLISKFDENMGKLVDFLDKNKLAENTILIFMSDNGSVKTGVFNAGMTGGKCTRTEGGHRVPCFIRWPGGNLLDPLDINTPAQVQDIFPTLIDLCNLRTPENAAFNGTSLKPLLKGQTFPDRMFVVQYHQNDYQKYDAAVIWNQWRLLPLWGDKLYDISKDMAQENNMAEAHPEIVRKMKEFYEEWWAEVEPVINDLVPNHIGSENQPEVTLYSSDWEEVRADGNNGPRQATERAKKGEEFTGGIWNIKVHKTGNYRVELRRYPREAGAAICAAVPEFKPRFGEPLPAGIPLDVTRANLVTANGEFESEVSEEDKSVVFNVDLKEGESELKAWFGNKKEPVVCGAYYAYVRLNE